MKRNLPTIMALVVVAIACPVGMGGWSDLAGTNTLTGTTGTQGPTTIAQVVRSSGPADFVARVTDWPRIGDVRVYVRIRGLQAKPDVDVFKAARDLERRLRQGQIIRLRNVQRHSYFRITADVDIDGRDLATQLAAGPYAERIQPATAPTATAGMESVAPTHDRWSFGPPRPRTGAKPIGAAGSTHGPPTRPGSRPAESAPTESTAPPVRIVSLSDMLNTPADVLHWTPRTPLKQALDDLRNAAQPPLPMVVLWNDLQNNALVGPDTPIGLSATGRIPIGQALRLVLLSVGGGRGRIGYVIRDGVITIATPAAGLNSRYVTRVYETGMLTMPAANVLQGMGYGQLGTGFGMGGGLGTGWGTGMGGVGGFGGYGGIGGYGGFGGAGGFGGGPWR